MTERRLNRAVVLAAGTGSRLGDCSDPSAHAGTALLGKLGASGPVPKPLRAVAGVPLLVRVLRTLQSVGVQEAVIVTGYQGDRLRRALKAEPSLGLKLIFVENSRYTAKNGVSLLAAAEHVDRECLLTMSDHLYSPDLVRRLMAAELPEGACGLAVDSDIERCFDIDDATKVRVDAAGRITDISKELETYDALDTGVFRIGPSLVRELAKLELERGDCSLSEGVRALAERGRFFACDVGEVRWIDVDTPPALERAEAMLRVFGDTLGDEPYAGGSPIDPEAIETFAPTWVRAVQPYDENHFAIANRQSGLLRMMSNESPYAPSPRVMAAIVEAATRGNLYPFGAPDLRRRLGERDGFGEGNVLLGAGSTELIDTVIRSFVAPGEEVLLSVPTFSMYEARTRTVGGIPVLVPLTEEHEHDVPQIIRAVTERTKVIFVCTPNNPTGNSIPEADLRRLLQLGLPTVIDEAYFEFGEGESFAPLINEFPNAIVLRTFSKAHGLAGLRLGYALGHAAVVRLLSRVKVPWNVPTLIIAAAIAALDDQPEFDARMTELKGARAALGRALGRVPGVVTLPSEGNFVLIDVSGTGLTAQGVVDEMLDEGVLIRSLGVHRFSPHSAGKSYVRITVGTADQNGRCASVFERTVRRLQKPQHGLTPTGVYVTARGDAE